ncbi:MAG: inorganic phosphate transporter [Bdellovibrionota bacterium]
MDLNIYFIAVLLLAGFAVFDLIVGVSNDAVNFLNSAIGSKVAPRHIIMCIASIGIILGVTFSGGMMEVARKGIFHPQFFTMPELMSLFLAVMLADVIILDLFNTFGLPTSTTVSIVFELLGAAIGLSIIKLLASDQSLLELGQYINTGKALVIIGGILLSVVIAFTCGAIIQFVSRLIFTFDYKSRLKSYGGLWGGIAFSCIAQFILLKGAKNASFIPSEISSWMEANVNLMFFYTFCVSAVVFQLLIWIFRVNILKPIVLIGTFALALAFAANDLVNFIGVPLAGYHAYNAAMLTANPLTTSMSSLAEKIPSSNLLLILSGVIMVLTLWISKKAQTVTDTEISLSSHDEDNEKFESVALSRVIVRMSSSVFDMIGVLIPRFFRKFVRRRLNNNSTELSAEVQHQPSFDLLRASVNLMVASIVVSYATILKLPLSTTYVTFMVAMGTSFADQAWGRETAVYRVTGVLTVIGGWFMTALMATLTAGCFVAVIQYFGIYGVLAIMLLVAYSVYNTHHAHKNKSDTLQEEAIYNLKKIEDAPKSIAETFGHTGYFLGQMQTSLNQGMEALFSENLSELRKHKRMRKKIDRWSNIIVANIFKAMRLLQSSGTDFDPEYSKTVGCLHTFAERYSNIISRSYEHVSQHHKGLLSIQVKELNEVKAVLNEILDDVQKVLVDEKSLNLDQVRAKGEKLEKLIENFHADQVQRIINRSSKTRLSILYYSHMGDMRNISRKCIRLLEIFDTCFLSKNF